MLAGIRARQRIQDSEPIHSPRLLRRRTKRHATLADERDRFAPPHGFFPVEHLNRQRATAKFLFNDFIGCVDKLIGLQRGT